MYISPLQMLELTKPFTDCDEYPITVEVITSSEIILNTYVSGSAPHYTPWRVAAGTDPRQFDTVEAAIVAARYELMLKVSKTEDAFLPCCYRQENLELTESLDEAESEIAQLELDLRDEKRLHHITKENFKNYIDECRVTYAGPSRKTVYTDTGKPVCGCPRKERSSDEGFGIFATIVTAGIVLAMIFS